MKNNKLAILGLLGTLIASSQSSCNRSESGSIKHGGVVTGQSTRRLDWKGGEIEYTFTIRRVESNVSMVGNEVYFTAEGENAINLSKKISQGQYVEVELPFTEYWESGSRVYSKTKFVNRSYDNGISWYDLSPSQVTIKAPPAVEVMNIYDSNKDGSIQIKELEKLLEKYNSKSTR